MATLTQLQAEPWWGNEIVPTTLDALEDRLCTRYGVPRYNAGDKGNEFHLYGRHRSIEWALNSAYCEDRSYGTQDGRDRRGNPRHIRAFDLKLPAAQLYAMCRRLDTAVRAGRLPKVAEWFGSFDGNVVVGWYEGHASSSDDSHLWHLHIGFWTEHTDDDHTDLYKILTGDDDVNLTDPIKMPQTDPLVTGEVIQPATYDVGTRLLFAHVHAYAARRTAEGVYAAIETLGDRLAAIEARLADPVDEAALAAQLAERLQPLAPGATVEQVREILASVRLSTGA